MAEKRSTLGVHPAWWTLILVVVIVAVAVITPIAFNRDFTSYATVTLDSDRSGLIMEPYAKVKYRGVEVGRVKSVEAGNPVRLHLELLPNELKYIPSNVGAQITAPTAFGAKYVQLLVPDDPSPSRLAAGATLRSEKVSDEVNTTFSNLVGVLDKIDATKLNGVLTALAEGFRGKGQQLGEATTDLNQYLSAINPRSETIRQDWRAVKDFSDTYAAAAQDIITVLDGVSTTSTTISDNAKVLDNLLLSVIGLSRTGVDLLGPNKDNLINGINLLEPTTRLLMKYNPVLTCTFVGGKTVLDTGLVAGSGGNGYSQILDAGLLFGDDAYKYPNHLPIVGQKGGPGGQPGCGSLPDVRNNWPLRYLVTNSGWGTGNDMRVNPGIGFPGYANYLPTTRAVPEPPSIRNIHGGPAIGPIPYPGAPPYGGQMYAPDGTPLYPGLPPAPPPMRAPDHGATPGSEPFTPPFPAQVQPTPLPFPPPPPPPPPPANAPPAP